MKRWLIPYLFLIPFFLDFAIFSIYTLGFGIYMSFTDFNLATTGPIANAKIIGLANYIKAVTDDPVFLKSIKNAFIYVLYEPICNVIGLMLALVLNSAVKGRSVFRTIFFIPVVTSTVAIAYVWGWLYDYTYGPLNYFLRSLGVPGQYWLSHLDVIPGTPPGTPIFPIALLSIMVMSTWQYFGLNVVIYLAALQSIPNELHEAARMSGANAWNSFRHVTVPLMKPAILFCALTATAGSLQVFTEVYMLTRGGPVDHTMVPVLWMQTQAFEFNRFGYGAALAYTFFLIILAVSLIEMRILRRGGMVYY